MSISPISTGKIPEPASPPKKRRCTTQAVAYVEEKTPLLQQTVPSFFEGLQSRQIAGLLPSLSSSQLPEALSLVDLPHLGKELINLDYPFALRLIEAMKELPQEIMWPFKMAAIYRGIPAVDHSRAFEQMNQAQKKALVPHITSLDSFRQFVETLSFPEDQPIVHQMFNQQLDWAFDWLSPEKLSAYITTLPPLYVQARVSESNPTKSSAHFALSLVHSPDFILEGELLTEQQLKIAVTLCSVDVIHDLFDSIPPEQVPSKFNELIPLMSDAKLTALVTLTFNPTMLAFMNQRQINMTVSVLEPACLKMALKRLSLTQLSQCIWHIHEIHRMEITLPLYSEVRYPESSNLGVIQSFQWWEIALIVTLDKRFTKFKECLDKLTPLQFETAVRCMRLHQVQEIYPYLPPSSQKVVIKNLVHHRHDLVQDTAYHTLPLLNDTEWRLNESLRETETTCKGLEKNIEKIGIRTSEKRLARLSSQTGHIERLVLQLHKGCKESLFSAYFFRDFFRSIQIGGSDIDKLCQSYESIAKRTQTLLSILTEPGGLKMRLERVRSKRASKAPPPRSAYSEELASNPDRVMILYQEARDALEQIGIEAEDLDNDDISWDDIVQAGLISMEILETHEIDDIESLKRFLSSDA